MPANSANPTYRLKKLRIVKHIQMQYKETPRYKMSMQNL